MNNVLMRIAAEVKLWKGHFIGQPPAVLASDPDKPILSGFTRQQKVFLISQVTRTRFYGGVPHNQSNKRPGKL